MNSSIIVPAILAGCVVLISALALALWLLLGPGPKRSWAFRHGQRLLAEGNWREALDIFRGLHQSERLPVRWETRLREAMSDCQRAASQEYLQQKEYEKALEALERSAELRQQDTASTRTQIIDQMLEDVRYLFSKTQKDETEQVHQLIARVLILKSPCPEASFWQALCFLREDKTGQAIDTFKTIVEGAVVDETAKKIDPYFYLGSLLLGQGEPREALRLLSEANRIDSNCPMVICQLARAMLASGGDAMIAVRALQRALGERGFGLWQHAPYLVWIEGFPEGKSYVRTLASKYTFSCPLWGKDYLAAQRQAQIALGEGYFKLGQYEQSAEVFERLSHVSAPSLDVLRGLGLSLVKLERYDQAFKHLRAAHELENPKQHITAGYLALCAARGKPATPEDKVNNINWALWLVRGFSAPEDTEWVDVLNQVFAEARAGGVTIELNDQLHLVDHLLSVRATDPLAADAIHHLQMTHPDAVRPAYAWLYCRAADIHDLRHEIATALFARVFRDPEPARRFFENEQWDFDELEYAFLERAAAADPGHFPEVLGPEYPHQGEQLLLNRAKRLQQEGHFDGARTAAEVLVKLAPGNAQAYDFLAQLCHRTGKPDEAIEQLQQWHVHDPSAWLPLLRLAVLYQNMGKTELADENIKASLSLSEGQQRARIAFLGARLKLSQAMDRNKSEQDADSFREKLTEVAELLRKCLQDDPEHIQAQWCLAAVSCLLDDEPALGSGTEFLAIKEFPEARQHLVTAVGRLQSGDAEGFRLACEKAASDPRWLGEIQYLQGWQAIDRNDAQQAAECFRRVADGSKTPSQDHARALVGGLEFFLGHYGEAIHHWKNLHPEAQQRWALTAPLAQTIFLAALADFHQGYFAQAAERLREAGKVGLRDARLGPLLHAALVRAGQQLLYPANDESNGRK